MILRQEDSRENEYFSQEIRQLLYGKGRNSYRILFTILEGQEVCTAFCISDILRSKLLVKIQKNPTPPNKLLQRNFVSETVVSGYSLFQPGEVQVLQNNFLLLARKAL